MGVSAVGVEARIHDKIIILSVDRRFKEAVGKNKNQATGREALLRCKHFYIYFEASFCLMVWVSAHLSSLPSSLSEFLNTFY